MALSVRNIDVYAMDAWIGDEPVFKISLSLFHSAGNAGQVSDVPDRPWKYLKASRQSRGPA
jgi:hypothetical protein